MPATWNDIPVNSWSELLSALHSPQLIPKRLDEGNHMRSPYVFRGMDNAAWHLDTSFQRLSKTSTAHSRVIERALIRTFRKYANAGSFDRQSEWYILAVAQHNGLPTRCLDWSGSPLVAAHFACGDPQQKGADGIIWCVNAGILRQINQQAAKSLQGIAWVYDTLLLEQSFPDLDALDRRAPDELMLLWEPPSLDQRIASQVGLLSILNNCDGSQEGFLQKHSQNYPDLVRRIILKSGMKSEARDMLDQNNISERTLYPGLPGLCTWLKRYYGEAW